MRSAPDKIRSCNTAGEKTEKYIIQTYAFDYGNEYNMIYNRFWMAADSLLERNFNILYNNLRQQYNK